MILKDYWKTDISRKIRILLNDSLDFSNGSSTFFPFNLIEIYLNNPEPDSSIGDYSEWVRFVLIHEMTHLFNFHEGSGFLKFIRKFSGSIPIYYPWIQAPSFVAEGMAILGETRFSKFGRMKTPEYKIMLKELAKKSKIPHYRKIYSSFMHWPGPQAVYLYGATFFDFLINEYGEYQLKMIVKSFGKNIITLATSLRFQDIYKTKLAKLWNNFRYSIKYDKKTKTKYIIRNGGFKKYPVFFKNNIYYFHKNPIKFPGLRKIDIVSKNDIKIKKIYNINSMSLCKEEEKIYFSSTNFYKTYYQYSDIYEYNLNTDEIKRLTKGQRASFPIKHKDLICFIKREKTKSYVAELNIRTQKIKILSKPFDNLAFLTISPDKNHLLATIKRKYFNWEIGLFNKNGELIKIFSTGLKKSFNPKWINNEEFYFITEYNDDYRLAKINIKTNDFFIYNDYNFPSLRYIEPINKDKIIASVFDYNGFNLILSDINQTFFNKHEISVIQNFNEKQTYENIKEHKSYSYNFLRDMIPKYSVITFRGNRGDYQSGIFIAGNDALNKNYFDLSLYYSNTLKRINTIFNYRFNVFFPEINFNISDITDYYISENSTSFFHNQKKYELSFNFPLITKYKYKLFFYSDIHIKQIKDMEMDESLIKKNNFNGIRAGIFYDSSQIYYDSISNSDGIKLGISFSKDFRTWGSNFNINSFLFDLRAYISLKKTDVLAFRFNYTNSWGQASYLLYLGGNTGKYGFQLAGNNPFNLLRGFPEGYFSGKEGYIFNLEIRKSLFKIEYPILFVRFERMYLSLFFDAGDIWITRDNYDLKYSAGIELTTIIKIIGYRLNFVIGLAKAINPSHDIMLYSRIGKSF